MTINKTKTLFWITMASLLASIVAFTVLYFGNPKEPLGTKIPQPTIGSTTTLSTSPKTSKGDNDLEVSQKYVAEVNGQRMEVPIVTTGTDSYGTKAIVTQEIDMTNIVSYAASMERERAKKEYKKNWEVGTGFGTHRGDNYIPIEVQRNYSKNKAVSVEVHQDVKNIKETTGWEIKHKWLF